MSLKHYRNQSKLLLKALQADSTEAAERVAKNLPRLSGCSVDQVLAAGVGLQEAQHVVARENGYGQWSDLPEEGAAGFEDLVKLTDADIDVLLRNTEQLDLIAAIKQLDEGAVSKRHQACLGLLQHVSERVRRYMLDEVQYIEVSDQQVEEAQDRILAQAEQLGEKGQISWPPGTRKAVVAPEKPTPVVPAELRLLSQPLDTLAPAQVRRIIHGLADMAAAYGIISIEASLDGCDSDFIAEAIRLAVDGTEPALLRDLAETLANTLVRYLETRQRMSIEGVAAIATIDNPRIVQHKVSSHYVVEPEEGYREPEGDLERALSRLQAHPASKMTLHELTEFMCDVSLIARRANAVRPEGLGVLERLAEAVDEELLGAGLHFLAGLERVPAEITSEFASMVEDLIAELERQGATDLAATRLRYRLVTAGIAAVQEGRRGPALDEALDVAMGE